MVDHSSAPHAPEGYLKKRAKNLKNHFAKGDPVAIARARAVYADLASGAGEFSLMRAQHVVAVELGFESWGALNKATAAEQRAAIGRQRRQGDKPRAASASSPAVSPAPGGAARSLRPLNAVIEARKRLEDVVSGNAVKKALGIDDDSPLGQLRRSKELLQLVKGGPVGGLAAAEAKMNVLRGAGIQHPKLSGIDAAMEKVKFTGLESVLEKAKFTGIESVLEKAKFTGIESVLEKVKFTGLDAAMEKVKLTGLDAVMEKVKLTGLDAVLEKVGTGVDMSGPRRSSSSTTFAEKMAIRSAGFHQKLTTLDAAEQKLKASKSRPLSGSLYGSATEDLIAKAHEMTVLQDKIAKVSFPVSALQQEMERLTSLSRPEPADGDDGHGNNEN